MSGRIAVTTLWLLATLAASHVHAQTVEYIHTDALGSIVAVTNASRTAIERREYEPYGRQLTPTVRNGPGYTGHVQDAATGLVYMQQRYYDAQLGRFLSGDPITAYVGDHRFFNRYAYGFNNPYKFNDPDGRCPSTEEPCPIFGKAQGTGTDGHADAGNADAERMAKSGEYKSVHLNQALATSSGDPRAGNQRPDVAGVRKDTGGVDTVEHPSKSQTVEQMDKKGEAMQEKLESVGKGGTHETRPISTAMKSMRGAGTVGAMVTAGGTAAAVASDPTPDGIKTAVGEALIGAVCGIMGGCADAE